MKSINMEKKEIVIYAISLLLVIGYLAYQANYNVYDNNEISNAFLANIYSQYKDKPNGQYSYKSAFEEEYDYFCAFRGGDSIKYETYESATQFIDFYRYEFAENIKLTKKDYKGPLIFFIKNEMIIKIIPLWNNNISIEQVPYYVNFEIKDITKTGRCFYPNETFIEKKHMNGYGLLTFTQGDN